MKLYWTLIFCLSLRLTKAIEAGSDNDSDSSQGIEGKAILDNDEHNAQAAENRIAAQVFAMLEHYKQEDPIGLPGAPIPDPMPVPNIEKGFPLGKMVMQDVTAHGLSKFKLTSIKADVNDLKVDALIELDKLEMKGIYTLSAVFSKTTGPFSVTLTKVKVKGMATLAVRRDGQLETDTISIDVSFTDMLMDFRNLGSFGSLFQSIFNSAPTLLFDTMKPFLFQEADKKLRTDINDNINKYMKDKKLPNSITPLDMTIAEGRKLVREMGYDPYRLPNYNRTTGIFTVNLENIWISGISSFYRVGNVIVSMENNTLELNLNIGTQRISGAGQWQVGFGLMSRYGHVSFTVEFIKAKISVAQPLDTRKRPKIRDLQIDLGNIQVRCDGAGTIDYIMEMLVNVIPNLLRYQIMDALENPLKVRIQEKFDTIDVEAAIKNGVEQFQGGGSSALPFDFKL